ncbi:hypothetical protein CLOP_g10160, partial [Closterium sp. NIES-67]
LGCIGVWKEAENVKELQQFLGFANYYNRFVPQYAKLAAPLTNLLKKNTSYKWETKHQEAVEQLKQALTSAPVLILPDPERDYVIEADASDQAVGAVLMQDQGNGLQPIAYLSKKLHGAELNYPIHDKEALAIVIAFKAWRCYLEGRRTTVYTDHCQPEIFEDTTQPFQAAGPVDRLPRDTLPLRHRVQARPQEQSRRSQPACTRCRDSDRRDESTTQGTLHPRVRHRPEIPLAEKRHLYSGTMTSHTGRIHKNLGTQLPSFAPVTTRRIPRRPVRGHFGSNKTLTGIAKHYYWPHMADDVQKFVTSCDTCQRMKSSKQKKAGLLQPLPVPEQPWQVLAWTFITGLPPTSSGHDAILVVIDSSPKWDTSSRHTRRHAPRRQHSSSFVTSSHSMASQLHSSPTETPSSPASSGRNLCLCSAPNSPCHPHTIRRQTDRRAPQPNSQVTPVTFRLRLPATWKIHNAFHVQLLKPYRDPNTIFVGRPAAAAAARPRPERTRVRGRVRACTSRR